MCVVKIFKMWNNLIFLIIGGPLSQKKKKKNYGKWKIHFEKNFLRSWRFNMSWSRIGILLDNAINK